MDDALATAVVLTMKAAIAPLQERIAVLEAKALTPPVVHVAPVPDLAPEEMAASLAGLLRKELADLEASVPTKLRRRIEKDGTGYTVTEERIEA